ncbi:MAG: DUF4349 domain-containing protein [Anaerolineales bacterium]|nr:DUF4349 domain-containing protein [Anaerolineales bacterium]
MKKRSLFLFVGILALLLGACGAASVRSEQAFEPGYEGGMTDSLAMAPEMERIVAAEDSLSYSESTASVERLVIRNAYISIVVSDPSDSLDEIASMAESLGGFVVSSNLYQTSYGEDLVADRGSITIRVPSESLDSALDHIKAGATEIQSESVSGEDVTDEYTDLNSKLRNLEAAETELLGIMENAQDADDVLAIFEHLRQIRQEIEITQGRIQYYEQSARLSSISVDLIPDVAAQPLTIGKWQPQGTAKAAVQALISALKFLGNAAIWIVIFVSPILLLIAAPIVLIVRGVRKRRKNKASKAEEA